MAHRPPERIQFDLGASVRLALSQTPHVFELVWAADKVGSLIFVVASFVGALLPLALAWLGKLIIDTVVLASKTGAQADRDYAIELVLIELGVMLSLGVIGLVTGVVRTNIGTKLAYF